MRVIACGLYNEQCVCINYCSGALERACEQHKGERESTREKIHRTYYGCEWVKKGLRHCLRCGIMHSWDWCIKLKRGALSPHDCLQAFSPFERARIIQKGCLVLSRPHMDWLHNENFLFCICTYPLHFPFCVCTSLICRIIFISGLTYKWSVICIQWEYSHAPFHFLRFPFQAILSQLVTSNKIFRV